ncbi:hypothetical protein POM88_034530 [Heracleum sosnowskyi]|uniref:Gnk2-homologous domain-containing protein n=1 Tax=Heracleum sosnowskyi TaxID=360622 RepID=A0AAD8HKH3_9APIA|nr:hypothetical protein POM88_034530 [Heracleum sosnowskyi]
MWSFQKCTIMMLSICWCLFSSLSTEAALSFGYPSCSGENSNTPGSTFQANLEKLLTFLSSNARKNHGFFNSTVGHSSPDVAYGVFLCRGDCSSDVCQACVSEATKEILTQCPREKAAAIWYDDCMCIPDLSGKDCGLCLREAMSFWPKCCDRKQGGRVLLYSCNIRYEVYPFFDILVSAPSPSPTPTSSLGKQKDGYIQTLTDGYIQTLSIVKKVQTVAKANKVTTHFLSS